MKLGIALGRLHSRLHEEMVLLADELGYESVAPGYTAGVRSARLGGV
jgi:hypothetical protein